MFSEYIVKKLGPLTFPKIPSLRFPKIQKFSKKIQKNFTFFN